MGSLLLTPFAQAKTPAQSPVFAAAWERNGSYQIGLLHPHTLLGALEVPTRAHALLPEADGSVLAVARRPGDWLVRWHPGRTQPPQWLWTEPARAFNGHAIASPDGHHIYTTETDLETGSALVGVRDARSLEKLAEWPTHGIDAHELIWDHHTTAAGSGQRRMATLIVANGGVPTAPETGRVKRDLHTMDSSLVRLHGDRGDVLGQWRLTDPRLSLRHLAWGPAGGTPGRKLGIALQAEHSAPVAKQAAPVLALFDGSSLRTCDAPPDIAARCNGYGGSMAATAQGWAVSCPRANGVATFAPDGTWAGLVPLEDAYALAVHGGALWASGAGQALQARGFSDSVAHPYPAGMQGVRMDNHWYAAASRRT